MHLLVHNNSNYVNPLSNTLEWLDFNSSIFLSTTLLLVRFTNRYCSKKKRIICVCTTQCALTMPTWTITIVVPITKQFKYDFGFFLCGKIFKQHWNYLLHNNCLIRFYSMDFMRRNKMCENLIWCETKNPIICRIKKNCFVESAKYRSILTLIITITKTDIRIYFIHTYNFVQSQFSCLHIWVYSFNSLSNYQSHFIRTHFLFDAFYCCITMHENSVKKHTHTQNNGKMLFNRNDISSCWCKSHPI